MAKIQVGITNESSVLTDAEVIAAVPALQYQVSNHFAPAWGIDADLTFIPGGIALNPDAWWLDIVDNPDQANAAGRHELTANGWPLGKVFAQFAQSVNIP